MGVKDLWSILEPSREKKLLHDFEGQTVAVDLGFWVCQMKTAVSNPTVVKPHIRNLFFRISALLNLGIQPIFVLDGIPPDIKQDAMRQRQNQRAKNGKGGGAPAWVKKKDTNNSSEISSKKMQRSRFLAELKECAELIRLLGLPVVESEGEAEGTCAALNRSGIVEAVITDDGDAFLYGARCVLRNFSLEGKEPVIDSYSSAKIVEDLNLSREKLVVLGLLIGCDYSPKGLPGVGREMALKFLILFSDGRDALDRLKSWRNPEAQPETKAETAIFKRAAALTNFPDQRILDEFLTERAVECSLVAGDGWREPDFRKLVLFLNGKLEWEESYAVSKVVPLVSLWNLKSLADKLTTASPSILPLQILKDRVKHGKSCFEVQWKKLECDCFTEEEFYVTLELASLFEAAFPALTASHREFIANKKNTKGKKQKKKEEIKIPRIDVEDKDIDVPPEPELEDILSNSIVCIDEDPEDKEVAEFRRSFLDVSSTESEVVSEPRLEACAVVQGLTAMHLQSHEALTKEQSLHSDSPLPLKERMRLKGLLM